MVLALLTSALVSIVCFIVTLLMGFMVVKTTLAQHVLFGFFTTFLVTLTQSMTMFYFIGTGKQVKDLVASLPERRATHSANEGIQGEGLSAVLVGDALHDGDDDYRRRRAHACCVDTAASARRLWRPLSLYFNIVAFWKEAKYMIENNILMEEVDRLLQ